MPHENFYTTAAQLLAAFAVTLLVLLPSVWRRQVQRVHEAQIDQDLILSREHFPHNEQDGFPARSLSFEVALLRRVNESHRQEQLYRAVQCAAALFWAGEGAALAVLLLGTDSWIVTVAGPITFLATMTLAALTVLLPLSTLPNKPQMNGFLPSTRHIDRVRVTYGWPSLRQQRRINRNATYRRSHSTLSHERRTPP